MPDYHRTITRNIYNIQPAASPRASSIYSAFDGNSEQFVIPAVRTKPQLNNLIPKNEPGASSSDLKGKGRVFIPESYEPSEAEAFAAAAMSNFVSSGIAHHGLDDIKSEHRDVVGIDANLPYEERYAQWKAKQPPTPQPALTTRRSLLGKIDAATTIRVTDISSQLTGSELTVALSEATDAVTELTPPAPAAVASKALNKPSTSAPTRELDAGGGHNATSQQTMASKRSQDFNGNHPAPSRRPPPVPKIAPAIPPGPYNPNAKHVSLQSVAFGGRYFDSTQPSTSSNPLPTPAVQLAQSVTNDSADSPRSDGPQMFDAAARLEAQKRKKACEPPKAWTVMVTFVPAKVKKYSQLKHHGMLQWISLMFLVLFWMYNISMLTWAAVVLAEAGLESWYIILAAGAVLLVLIYAILATERLSRTPERPRTWRQTKTFWVLSSSMFLAAALLITGLIALVEHRIDAEQTPSEYNIAPDAAIWIVWHAMPAYYIGLGGYAFSGVLHIFMLARTFRDAGKFVLWASSLPRPVEVPGVLANPDGVSSVRGQVVGLRDFAAAGVAA